MSPPAAYFLSDAHLGADSDASERAQRTRLHDFLNSLAGRASALYIVGDLFDFWFEYRSAIPRRLFSTLSVLERLRSSGLEITYLNGNHDFWLGHFLSAELGIRTVDGALPLELQGRRLWVHHGDGLAGGDLGYRVLKRVLRSPISIGLYRWVHPDLGIPLAHWASNLSRDTKGERPLEPERLWNEIAVPRFKAGYDAVVIGHFHHLYERREAGREFFVLGDWIRRFTYLRLEEGVFTLETWSGA
jgi:UDP-2,3-diacylglucosamine hydrolase